MASYALSFNKYAKTVQPLAYDFKIKIPEDAAKTSAPPSVAGMTLPVAGLQIGGLVIGGTSSVSPAKWFVEGQLDIPLGIDVKTRVQISV